ncbi:MAG: hypothetical protein AAF641_07475 [Pseudomonadota bacterium]
MTFFRLLAFSICCIPVAVFSFDEGAQNGSAKFLELHSYCKKYGCKKGPSIKDPPILTSVWSPFESSSLLVWGADVCLGYFLTKDAGAWNGGSTLDTVDELHGIYVELGDFEARVHLSDRPFGVEGSPQEGYGVFNCKNARWPEHSLTNAEKDEIQRWIENRLSTTNGWVGGLEDWSSSTVGKVVGQFRNEALGLTVEFRNWDDTGTIYFYADYFGPPVWTGSPGSLY